VVTTPANTPYRDDPMSIIDVDRQPIMGSVGCRVASTSASERRWAAA
jgi:hypothetical protein